jgi:hypothetical protein
VSSGVLFPYTKTKVLLGSLFKTDFKIERTGDSASRYKGGVIFLAICIGSERKLPSGVPTSRTSPALSFEQIEKTPFLLLLLKYAIHHFQATSNRIARRIS